MAKNIKTVLQQAFLDYLAWPFLKTFISNLPEPERNEALEESKARIIALAKRYPGGASYFAKELQKIIPDDEPLETFETIDQLPSGERKK